MKERGYVPKNTETGTQELERVPETMGNEPKIPSNSPKIKGWVARDKSGNLNFFLGKPRRFTNSRGEEYWIGHARMKQPNEFCPELRWESDPIECELTIRKYKCKEK